MNQRTFLVNIPKKFTAVIHKEGKWYIADCPEIGTVSQGKTIESALKNLRDATKGYFKVFGEKQIF